MQSFIYDIDRKVFRNSSGLVRTSFKPSISYGERSTWEIQIQATDAGVVSLGGATAWRAAIDQDFTSSTEPMVRTTSGITVDTTGEWPVATLSLDTLTERFLAVCDGRQSTPVYFELAGLDANGDTVFYLCFAIDALFPIDPQAAGTLAPVEVTTLTESQVQAIARAAGEAAAKDAATSAASTVAADLTTHTSDTAIHVPTSGTTGQVLTKTDTGTEWKDAPTSSGSSSGSTDLSDYYTKGEVSTLVSSETTARAAADSALETRVKALEQGSSGTVAVTGGVVPVDALPVASESTSGTVYYLTTDGHHYQVVPIGTADALGVRLSGDSIAFAGDYLPTGETTSVTYQDMTTLESVTKSFPVYSDGTRYLFAVVNSYALAPLYAIASSTTATPDYYAPSSDIAALSGDWYDSTYTTKSTVTAAQYVLEDVSHAYTLPTASASTLGGVKVGTGLTVSEDGVLSSTGEAYTLPTASASTLGGVKVGTGLTVSEDGTLSSTGEAYTLPTASASTLGGVKVGTGLSVSEDGTLSATASGSGSGVTEDSSGVECVHEVSTIAEMNTVANVDQEKLHAIAPIGDIAVGEEAVGTKYLLKDRTNTDYLPVDTLMPGRSYLVQYQGGGSTALSRDIVTNTYKSDRVWLINNSTGSYYTNWSLNAERDGKTLYITPNQIISFTDRREVKTWPNKPLNNYWPTYTVNPLDVLEDILEDFEQEGTYLGTGPSMLAAGVSGDTLKYTGGAWHKGTLSRNSSGTLSESLDMDTTWSLEFMWKQPDGTYKCKYSTGDAIAAYSTKTGKESQVLVELTGNIDTTLLDVTPGPLRYVSLSSVEALSLMPGIAYTLTLTCNMTLSVTITDSTLRQEAFLDINPGTYKLREGGNLTFADSLMPGKLNHCHIVWHGTSARLYVYDVEDTGSSSGGDDSGDTSTATLTVTLEGTTSGAWSVDGGTTWKSSGESVTATEGTVYEVTFKAVDGYTTPDAQSVTLVAGANALTATYTEEATTTVAFAVSGLTADSSPSGDLSVYMGDYEVDGTTTYNGTTYTRYKLAGGAYYLAHCATTSHWGFSTKAEPSTPSDCDMYGYFNTTSPTAPTATQLQSLSWTDASGVLLSMTFK